MHDFYLSPEQLARLGADPSTKELREFLRSYFEKQPPTAEVQVILNLLTALDNDEQSLEDLVGQVVHMAKRAGIVEDTRALTGPHVILLAARLLKWIEQARQSIACGQCRSGDHSMHDASVHALGCQNTGCNCIDETWRKREGS